MTINNNHGVALVARGLKKGFKVGRGRTEVLKDVGCRFNQVITKPWT